MYDPHRVPDPAWVAALSGLAPMREQASHLAIHWHAGTPDAPVGRWVIFDCVPVQAADVFGLSADLDTALEQDPDDPMLRWAATMRREAAHVPTPVWIVQGHEGGHPWKYTANERVLANAGLLPAELPAIGALPYAEPDHRTWGALHKRQVLARTMKDAHDARMLAREASEQQARAALVAQATEALSADVSHGLTDILDTATPLTREDARGTAAVVSDEHLARYIETGDLTLTT